MLNMKHLTPKTNSVCLESLVLFFFLLSFSVFLDLPSSVSEEKYKAKD